MSSIIESVKIEDKLHVIAVIFNPTMKSLSNNSKTYSYEYELRYKLFNEFKERMENEEPDVILYIVEMTYGSQEFIITDKNNPRHLQLHSDVPLWHRENMINLGIKHLLPPDWKAVAWIDGDIEFENKFWARDTLKLLNKTYDIVQLYSSCNFLLDEYEDKKPYVREIFNSFGYNHVNDYNFELNNYNEGFHNWHHGFATACSRKMYDQISGLIEFIPFGFYEYALFSCFREDTYKSSLKILKKYENIILEIKNII